MAIIDFCCKLASRGDFVPRELLRGVVEPWSAFNPFKSRVLQGFYLPDHL